MCIPRLLHPSLTLLLLVSLLIPTATEARVSPQERASATTPPTSAVTMACPMTAPNGAFYPQEPAGGNHGNDALVTALWPASGVEFKPRGAGCVEPDGYLGMKWPWWRRVRGPLRIEGRRLDGPAGPIRAHISDYGPTGFQPIGLMFAGPGCWEVTGRVADQALTFVTLVTKVGDGPAARCSALFGGYKPGQD